MCNEQELLETKNYRVVFFLGRIVNYVDKPIIKAN